MLLSFMSESVWPMVSSKSFIVSGLISRSLIHCEFIFVYGVRECSYFILSHVAVQFCQHHLLNKLSFLHCIYSYLLGHRWVGCRCVGLILGFLSCSTDLYFCLCASIIRFWWLLLCSIVCSLGAWFLQLHFSFSVCLCFFWVFCASKQALKYFVWVLWKCPW